MSYGDDNESASDHDFGDLFGSEDEASDIDDGRSQSSTEEQGSPAAVPTATSSSPSPIATASNNKSNDLDNLFGSDDESDSEEEEDKRQTLKQRRFVLFPLYVYCIQLFFLSFSRIDSSEDEESSNRRSPARYEEEEEEREEYDEYEDQLSKKTTRRSFT